MITLVWSCTKKDLFKNPTPVSFSFAVQNNGPSGSDDLTLNSSGNIVLANFSVIGERDQAEDFEFVRDFPGGLSIPFNHVQAIPDLEFELPQGDYNKITVRFETLQGNGTNLDVTGNFVYNNPQKPNSLVQVNLSQAHTFEVDVTDGLGRIALTLDELKAETPQIVLNPRSWLANVDDNMLNAANVQMINNVQTILVDMNNNNNIYNEVLLGLGMDIECEL